MRSPLLDPAPGDTIRRGAGRDAVVYRVLHTGGGYVDVVFTRSNPAAGEKPYHYRYTLSLWRKYIAPGAAVVERA